MSKEAIWELLSKKLAGEASEAELAELELWLRQDPDMHYAADHVAGLWEQPVKAAPQQTDHAWEDHLARMEQRGVSLEEDTLEDRNGSLPFYKKISTWLSAAAVLIIVAGTWWGMRSGAPLLRGNNSLPEEVVTTAKGTRSRVVLPDGSVVLLNADSKLMYDSAFDGPLRNVQLEGEAYFDVAHDKKRPFIIHTAQMDIKVLGTAFNVKAYASDGFAETALVRGSVEVQVLNADMKPILLKPNEKIVVKGERPSAVQEETGEKSTASTKTVLVQPLHYTRADSIRIETAWVANTLVFEDESFAELAVKMERWFGVDIRFLDEKIAALRFTGKFDRETCEEALKALQITAEFTYAHNGKSILINH